MGIDRRRSPLYGPIVQHDCPGWDGGGSDTTVPQKALLPNKKQRESWFSVQPDQSSVPSPPQSRSKPNTAIGRWMDPIEDQAGNNHPDMLGIPGRFKGGPFTVWRRGSSMTKTEAAGAIAFKVLSHCKFSSCEKSKLYVALPSRLAESWPGSLRIEIRFKSDHNSLPMGRQYYHVVLLDLPHSTLPNPDSEESGWKAGCSPIGGGGGTSSSRAALSLVRERAFLGSELLYTSAPLVRHS